MYTKKQMLTLSLLLTFVSTTTQAAIFIPEAHLQTFNFVPGSTGAVDTVIVENSVVDESFSIFDNFGSELNYGYSVELGEKPYVSGYAYGIASDPIRSGVWRSGSASLFWYFAVVDDLPQRVIQLEVDSLSVVSMSTSDAARFRGLNLDSGAGARIGGGVISVVRTPTNATGSIISTITDGQVPRTISVHTNSLIEVRQDVHVGGGVWGSDFISSCASNSFSFKVKEGQGIENGNVLMSRGVNAVGVVPESESMLMWIIGLIGVALAGRWRSKPILS